MACRIQPITSPLTPRNTQHLYDETRTAIEEVQVDLLSAEQLLALKLEAGTSYILTGVVVPGD